MKKAKIRIIPPYETISWLGGTTHASIHVEEFTDGEHSGGCFFDTLPEAEEYAKNFEQFNLVQ